MIQVWHCSILDEEEQIFQDLRAGHTACEENEGQCITVMVKLMLVIKINVPTITRDRQDMV